MTLLMKVTNQKPSIQDILKAFPDYYLAIEASPTKFEIVGATAAFMKNLGLYQKDIIGRQINQVFSSLLSPGGIDVVKTSLVQAVASKTIQSTQAIVMPAANKQINTWQVTNYPIVELDGAVRYIIQSFREVNLGNLKDEFESENNASLFTFAEAIPHMTWIMNGDGKPLHYNKLWREYADSRRRTDSI